ncbi:unnamed protein product [Darwinula stevensoni]|uniref:ABC transporter domain-containing protein n=1 Tax=Darwinula stevensoni TaxID=69355 RepID=A0A7R9A2R8_9CRUS|nr:unnamed protein product [Darwinula stevensoni]CAG0880061.1 unnamed protein product [Darwinula stevensoni]
MIHSSRDQPIPYRASWDEHYGWMSSSPSEGMNSSTRAVDSEEVGVKHILKEIDGHIRCGQLTAIMGPSGAGKTCFMNVLAGYTTKGVTGAVTVNGRARNLRKFRKLSAYITQEDHLMECLSVGESMAMAANLKLPATLSKEEKANVVAEILENLGLCECVKTRAQSLSGGQRKRLCIALELVNNPPIMFFDEPTSGLDSLSCEQCINLLNTLAKEGRTIICTIHQPSAKILEMFSQLILLADGRCFYAGSVKSLVPYLGETHDLHCPPYHNPADYVLELAGVQHGMLEQLVQATRDGKCLEYDLEHNKDFFRTSSKLSRQNTLMSRQNSTQPDRVRGGGEKREDIEMKARMEMGLLEEKLEVEEEGDEHVPSFAVSFFTQLRILTYRSLLSTIRDKNNGYNRNFIKRTIQRFLETNSTEDRHRSGRPKSVSTTANIKRMLMNVRIASHIGMGLLISLMFVGLGDDASRVYNNLSAILFTKFFLMFSSMLSTILTFPLEMPVLVRETMNSWYNPITYYLAKTIIDIPFQIIFTLCYLVIVYFITSQPLSTERFLMYFAICAYVSLISQTMGLLIGAAFKIQTAVFVGPVCSVPLFLFSGFFLSVKAMPQYYTWISYLSFMRYIYEGSMFCIYSFDREDLTCKQPFCLFKDPKQFLAQVDLDHNVYWDDFWILFGFVLALRIACYILLRWRLLLR